MSLSVVGVWAVGVWDETVWADGVWQEGAAPASATKGGSSVSSAEKRRKRDLAIAKRKAARQAALKDADALFDSLFGEDEEVEGVRIEGLPKRPVKETLKEIALIKDKVVRKLAELNQKALIAAHNKKVREYEEHIKKLEEELVAILILTEEEDIGVIELNVG